jgi:TrkA domain protein
MLRLPDDISNPVHGIKKMLGDTDLGVYTIPGGCSIAGETIANSNFREETGALILAVQRGEKTIPNPPSDWKFECGDVVLLLGSSKALTTAGKKLASLDVEEE